jgi:hypothetical protein
VYNEDQKIKFLKDTRSSWPGAESTFRVMQALEEEYQMDLCLLPTDVLQTYINAKFGTRSTATMTYIKFLRSYCKWCADNGIKTSGGIFGVEVQFDEKLKQLTASSPKHLETILNLAFDPVERETTDCLYRCYLWMAFAGIRDREAVEVKTREVDFDSLLIHHNGRSFEFYKEAVPAFKNACELPDFVYAHPKYITRRNRLPSEYLLRGVRSEKPGLTTMRDKMHVYLLYQNIQITYRTIFLSGIFYRAYEMERAGFTPDFSAAVIEQITKPGKVYSSVEQKKHNAQLIEKAFLEDYQNWKRAFQV